MKSTFCFIVEPLGNRYKNKKNIGDKELILNTSLESFKHVNNIARVVEIPLFFESNIKKGDLVIIHHNVFRVFYNIRGEKKNSRSYLFNNLFICEPEQIFLHKTSEKWKTLNDRCFIKPLKNKSNLSTNKERELIGILKYGNSELESLGLHEGDTVGYKPYGEFDFVVENERLYCMRTNDVIVKYDFNEENVEYNPNWTKNEHGDKSN
tara:strand:+ start:489 stop:1112 length:624 start_codon:yes stop_codon:yes gene_type:complete